MPSKGEQAFINDMLILKSVCVCVCGGGLKYHLRLRVSVFRDDNHFIMINRSQC